jgi:hypothetical protein
MDAGVYAMDVKDNAMVVACADKMIYVFDLANPNQPIKSHASPLRHQVCPSSAFLPRVSCVRKKQGAIDHTRTHARTRTYAHTHTHTYMARTCTFTHTHITTCVPA